jgi:4a-hydroxytetrahydrobiopterin dehydratase
MSLADRTCQPCQGGMPPLTPDQVAPLARQVPEWEVVDNHHLEREFRFPDFVTALGFVNAVGAEAESQGHHPDLELSWGRVGVTLYTHKIDGLAEADFVLAARIDRLAGGLPAGHENSCPPSTPDDERGVDSGHAGAPRET